MAYMTAITWQQHMANIVRGSRESVKASLQCTFTDYSDITVTKLVMILLPDA